MLVACRVHGPVPGGDHCPTHNPGSASARHSGFLGSPCYARPRGRVWHRQRYCPRDAHKVPGSRAGAAAMPSGGNYTCGEKLWTIYLTAMSTHLAGVRSQPLWRLSDSPFRPSVTWPGTKIDTVSYCGHTDGAQPGLSCKPPPRHRRQIVAKIKY